MGPNGTRYQIAKSAVLDMQVPRPVSSSFLVGRGEQVFPDPGTA
jgi:hypothetical protein